MGWLSGYNTRRKLTIDSTKIDSNLSDFPVLVKLTSSNFDFSKANSDGYDIRFTSSDGTTLLKYERERHDSANQVAEYWVKIPSVSASADTEFYIYYRTTDTADGADPTNVWDSNFKGVWHLKESGNGTADEFKDSTANANHGTGGSGTSQNDGTPSQADGKIGKCQEFDAANDERIEIPADATLKPDYITLEAWCNRTSGEPLVMKAWSDTGWTSPWDNYVLKTTNDVKSSARFVNESQTRVDFAGSTTGSNGTWYYFVATFDGSKGRVYRNGSEDGSVDLTGTLGKRDTTVNIGGLNPGTGVDWYFTGKIDEVRISNIARSAAWLKASYNSGNDTLLTYGSEEEAAAGHSYGYIF